MIYVMLFQFTINRQESEFLYSMGMLLTEQKEAAVKAEDADPSPEGEGGEDGRGRDEGGRGGRGRGRGRGGKLSQKERKRQRQEQSLTAMCLVRASDHQMLHEVSLWTFLQLDTGWLYLVSRNVLFESSSFGLQPSDLGSIY